MIKIFFDLNVYLWKFPVTYKENSQIMFLFVIGRPWFLNPDAMKLNPIDIYILCEFYSELTNSSHI